VKFAAQVPVCCRRLAATGVGTIKHAQ
jgi:hypothetical protein